MQMLRIITSFFTSVNVHNFANKKTLPEFRGRTGDSNSGDKKQGSSTLTRAEKVRMNQQDLQITMSHGEELALKFQWKLYAVFHSVMKDYSAVFTNFNRPSTPGGTLMPHNGKRVGNKSVYGGGAGAFTAHYRVKASARPEVYNIVSDVLERMNDWEELPQGLALGNTWNLLWTWSRPKITYSSLLSWQRVNHFPSSRALTRKDSLKKTISRFCNLGGRIGAAFDILPVTFILPQEYLAFVDHFTKVSQGPVNISIEDNSVSPPSNLWIMKPVGSSRGRGISVVNDIASVCYGDSSVIQKYVDNPLLLDGYKFDLRIYVLVTSFNPLEAFIYDEGFCRLSTHKYSIDSKDIGNKFIHLTNSSIQKHNHEGIAKDNALQHGNSEQVGGTKTNLTYLWGRMKKMGIDVEKMKISIEDVIVKSLVAVEDSIPFQVNSFEVYGYDVLIDQNLKSWLIEVNSSPSMARENQLDIDVKEQMIHDTIRLVDPLCYDRHALLKVLEERLLVLEKERNKPYVASFLGSGNTSTTGGMSYSMKEMNAWITQILHGKRPRMYGELPAEMGDYRRICPGPLHDAAMKLKRTYIRS